MPRNLSAAANAYTGPMLWVAELTLRSGAKKYFAEDAVTVGGNSYQPYLRVAGGPRFTRTLQADFGELELLNTDLVVGALLQTEDFEGALCELKQYLRGIEEAVLILRGRLTEQEETDQGVKFRLVSELDPAQLSLHAREYAQLCTWRFRQKPCGYLEASMPTSFSASLVEQAADIFSAQTIGTSTLTMVVNEHADRIVVLTAGTGRGQKRRIRSNTATTLTLYHPWTTTPDSTSKFAVYAAAGVGAPFGAGAPKLLFTSTSAQVSAVASAALAGARTIGSLGLGMVAGEHAGDMVRIILGAGAGQQRKIKTNTATQVTLDDAEPDFSPLPDITSTFIVLYARCPKDFPSCEDRARTQAFNAFPTLLPILNRIYGGRFGTGLFDEGDLGAGRGRILAPLL